MSSFVRITISVPAATRARMDAVAVPVTWSRVAARAFAATLDDLERRRVVPLHEFVTVAIVRLDYAADREAAP